jgi:hypothetical protein
METLNVAAAITADYRRPAQKRHALVSQALRQHPLQLVCPFNGRNFIAAI